MKRSRDDSGDEGDGDVEQQRVSRGLGLGRYVSDV